VAKFGNAIVVGFVLVALFLATWIFGGDIQGLGISLITVLVAGSFAFGSTAQRFVEGLVLLFVMRPYDVGDRVFLYDSSFKEWNLVVCRIDILTTTFTAASGQRLTVPNHRLINLDIRNAQRSGPTTHFFEMRVPFDTSQETVAAVEREVTTEARRLRLGVDGMSMAFGDVNPANNFGLLLTFTAVQDQSWQDNGARWQTRDVLVRLLHASLLRHAVEFAHPVREVGVTPPRPSAQFAPSFAGATVT
jgi:hypothetical protein